MLHLVESVGGATGTMFAIAVLFTYPMAAAKSDDSLLRQTFREAMEDLEVLLRKETRTITGVGNNILFEDWGASEQPFVRMSPVAYKNGHTQPSGSVRPNPRSISNEVADQTESKPNSKEAADMFWQWGQFIDHDLTLSFAKKEKFNILVPNCDKIFDPQCTGKKELAFQRSAYEMSHGVREQINSDTAFLDASVVYGSDNERASKLREHKGGRLKTSGDGGEYLPRDEVTNHFLAGDERANEHVGLMAMHTIWMREHNTVAGVLEEIFPLGTDDDIYELARRIVGAEIQHITYNEFLPLLLGRDAGIPPYQGYDATVNPGIANEFATVAYRVGHTLLSAQLQVCGENALMLRDAFFAPNKFLELGGPDKFLCGLAGQMCQDVDAFIVDDVRQFLFKGIAPHQRGFDLAALNIQRGRDHGIGTYNDVREAYGLERRTSFDQISSDVHVSVRLESVYDLVDDVDPWVGCIAEDHYGDAMVGETIHTIVKDQFIRLRDGDRFYYENDMPESLIKFVESQKLKDVIVRNVDIGGWKVPEDVMESPWITA